MSDLPAWLDYANAISTGAAALLAAGALIQSARNSNANEKALIRERRIDFELDVLADLVELATQSANVVTRDARMKARALVLDVDVIPLTRAVLELRTTSEASTRVTEREPERRETRQTRVEFWGQEITQELLHAVRTRLEYRL